MLLVHPLRELLRFLPVVLGLLVFGSTTGGPIWLRWELLGVAVPVVLGLLRYLTTSYRILDGRVELRRGLLQRHVLTAQLDRVRTVDTTATLLQRLLGLASVKIGTGSAEQDLDLDGLRATRSRALRAELLRESTETPPAVEQGELVVPAPAPPPPSRTVLQLDPSWARYAPLTGTGLLIAGTLIGVWTQLPGPLRLDPSGLASSGLGGPLLALVGLVALAVVVSALAVGGYLVNNWGLVLRHEATPTGGGTWHLSRGLTTTRETSADDERVAGVSLTEPLGLRLAGAARLESIVTGLRGEGQSAMELSPPAPRAVVAGVAAEVLGRPAPPTVPLVRHGAAAVRRRWTRAVLPALVLGAGCVALVLTGTTGAWPLVPAVIAPLLGVLLAVDRSRALGHALVEGHLVARSGSLLRRRDMLDTTHVIGWNLTATWFQRRAGLTTLVATTAGGRQSVRLLDLPEAQAVQVADAAVPGLLAQFRH